MLDRIVHGCIRFFIGLVATIFTGAVEGGITGMIGAMIMRDGRTTHLLDGAAVGGWIASTVAVGVGVITFVPVSIFCARLDDDRVLFRKALRGVLFGSAIGIAIVAPLTMLLLKLLGEKSLFDDILDRRSHGFVGGVIIGFVVGALSGVVSAMVKERGKSTGEVGNAYWP